MNPPYRVLAHVGRSRTLTEWLIWREQIAHFVDVRGRWYKAADVRHTGHPKNDIEAIEIINQARMAKQNEIYNQSLARRAAKRKSAAKS